MIRRVVGLLLLFPVLLFADLSKGKELTKELWKNLQSQNSKWLDDHTSSAFQFVMIDNRLNKSETLQFVKQLHILSYHLGPMTVTQKRNLFLVSYTATVLQRIGSSVFTKNGNRLTIWAKKSGTWLCVSQTDTSPSLPPSS